MKKLFKWIVFVFIGVLVLGLFVDSDKSPEKKAEQQAEQQAGLEQAVADPAPRKTFDLTEQGIKTLDKSIAKVDVTLQIDGSSNLVEVQVNRNPLTGGKNDWNGIAQDSHRLMSKLFTLPEVSRVRISYISPENNNLDWAHIAATKSELPTDWESLSYLQFFGKTKPLPGTLETRRWLCDFYGTYKSAQPDAGVPKNCKV